MEELDRITVDYLDNKILGNSGDTILIPQH